jgi:hypothetical protein
MVIDQKNSFEHDLLKKYTSVHRIHLINGISQKFQIILNQIHIFNIRDFGNSLKK